MNRKLMLALLLMSLAGLAGAADLDSRQKINLPEMMKQHMLGRMRDHLLALNEIQYALANGELDKASDIAETRIGMSSMSLQMRQEMAPHMPKAMRKIGMEMHRAASRFAMKATEGDPLPALNSLSAVTQQCVACHAAYRLN